MILVETVLYREGGALFCIAVCEDDIYTRLDVAKKAGAYCEERKLDHSIREFASGEELLACESAFDLAIMDIQMKGIDGLATARALQVRDAAVRFIFLTSFPDYVFDSFNVNVVAYLVKPLDEGKFSASMDKATAGGLPEERRFILVKCGALISKVYCDDIIYCESLKHKVKIETKSDRLEYYGSIDALCAQLGKNFFRIHRAFTVNLDCVLKRKGDLITMTGGHTLPLARRKQQAFTSALLSHLQGDLG